MQAILAGRATSITPRPRNNQDFPLRGFVVCGDCGDPTTGSWSKGRNKHYGYYHCQDGCTRVPKDQMEEQFEQFLRKLQPNADYLRLYREVVLDVWRNKQVDAEKEHAALSRQLRELREKKEKLQESFVYQKAIDSETYREMSAKILEEITLAEMHMRDVNAEEVEVEAALEFAEGVLLNASNLWRAASVDQKQRLQRVLFPEGVEYLEGAYRTSVTCPLFIGMPGEPLEKEDLVAQTILSWNRLKCWLKDMDRLRRSMA